VPVFPFSLLDKGKPRKEFRIGIFSSLYFPPSPLGRAFMVPGGFLSFPKNTPRGEQVSWTFVYFPPRPRVPLPILNTLNVFAIDVASLDVSSFLSLKVSAPFESSSQIVFFINSAVGSAVIPPFVDLVLSDIDRRGISWFSHFPLQFLLSPLDSFSASTGRSAQLWPRFVFWFMSVFSFLFFFPPDFVLLRCDVLISRVSLLFLLLGPRITLSYPPPDFFDPCFPSESLLPDFHRNHTLPQHLAHTT